MSYRFFSKATDAGFSCKCGCGGGWDNMNPLTLRKLDKARALASVPFAINSGYRCPAHNAAVSSTGENGPHTSGRAVDIRATDSATRYKIIQALLEVGFTRIGVAKTFIHADDDPTKPAGVCWFY
jgi:zinc D-Ala-D-Ala carboxypeptidase